MYRARFRFYSDLIELLAYNRREKTFELSFGHDQSVKHLIEAVRVPHTEVGKILVNGISVDFSYLVQDGDTVEIYPFAASGSDRRAEAATLVTPDFALFSLGKNGQPRFILDNHLGKLAAYLRMLGFDTLYRNDYQDDELAKVASEEDRILLSRDRGLLMRRAILRGHCLHTMDPKQQVVEVVQRFDLFDEIKPFQRCLRCNSSLHPVDKQLILDRLEPLTRLYYNEFHICPACDQIYWKGSHYERMRRFLEKIRAEK